MVFMVRALVIANFLKKLVSVVKIFVRVAFVSPNYLGRLRCHRSFSDSQNYFGG